MQHALHYLAYIVNIELSVEASCGLYPKWVWQIMIVGKMK
jgi:hypothetical protein